MATGEIIVFLTQDVLLSDEHTLEHISDVFEDELISVAYGRQLSYESTNLFGKHLRSFNYPEVAYVRTQQDSDKYGIKTPFLSNSFAAYRKTALQSIGWFKDELILGEDVYAGAKMILAGYKIAYVAKAQVYHSHSYTVFEEFKRYVDIGVFHRCESWILEKFGKVEGEGMRYVASELQYLLDKKAWYLIPGSIIRNAMKYLGYKLGYNYKKLPKWLIKRVSMNSQWWEKEKNNV